MGNRGEPAGEGRAFRPQGRVQSTILCAARAGLLALHGIRQCLLTRPFVFEIAQADRDPAGCRTRLAAFESVSHDRRKRPWSCYRRYCAFTRTAGIHPCHFASSALWCLRDFR